MQLDAARTILEMEQAGEGHPMERRLAAVLAADVVGYSQLMAEDESGTYDALRSALSEVVVPTIQRYAGDLFKTTGDGFLAAFGSVSQALEAAVAIQEAFASRALRLGHGRSFTP